MGKQTTSTSSSTGSSTDTPKPLQVFKSGNHITMAGQTIQFAEADLQATCKAYNPALFEAPLVIGHPSHDAPAYGWVQSLQFCDGAIDATPAQVNPDFAEMVAAGAYKKISASFYSPDAPQNPVPGVFYLRHVGFLGAQAPAVKGLRTPSFSEGEAGVVSFAEWDGVDNANLWRRMREWLIGKFGQTDADTVVPGYMVQSLEQSAQDELKEAAAESASSAAAQALPSPAFSEKESIVTEAEKAALQAENQRLAADLAASRALIAAATHAQAHANNLAFCEALVSQGRLLPAYTAVALATLDHFATQSAVVEFGEGEAKAPLPDAFKAMLSALPVQVSFGESATAANAGGVADTVSFSAPAGYQVDAVALGQLAKAKAYQAEHKVSFIEAVTAVQAQA